MIINQKGFTLIELMVALVILTILMGFAIPEVLNQINLSKFETQKANIKEIQRAINQHYADRGIYPSQLEDLTKTEGVIKVDVSRIKADDLQSYIDKNKLVASGGNYYKRKDYAAYFTVIPVDPVAGNSYWEVGVKWVEKSPPPGQDKPKEIVKWYRTSLMNYPGAPPEVSYSKIGVAIGSTTYNHVTVSNQVIDGIECEFKGIVKVRPKP